MKTQESFLINLRGSMRSLIQKILKNNPFVRHKLQYWMAKRIYWNAEEGVAVIVASEIGLIENMESSFHEAFDLVYCHQGCGILVDAREVLNLPTLKELYQFVTDFSLNVPIAILHGKAEEDKIEFSVGLAQQCMKLVRNFHDIKEALEWLRDSRW